MKHMNKSSNFQSKKAQLGRYASVKTSVSKTADQWLAKNRSLVLRQTPIWAYSFAGFVLSIGVIAVASSILFKIDEVVTVAGQLESVTGNTEVKTPAGGKVSQVFFKDGQKVSKGDLLVKFDTRQAQAQKNTLTNLIRIEKEDLASKLRIIEKRISVLEKKKKTSQSIVDELRTLVALGGFQRIQYLEQLDTLYEQESMLENLNLERNRAALESEKSIGQMSKQLKDAELLLQYQTVLAPVSGIVFDPQVSADGVIQAGETILSIVPQDSLKALIFVPNKDIGFVKGGQKAKVRVDAFPFSRYGEINASVVQIGADALPPDSTSNQYRFPVKLSLDRSSLNYQDITIPLRSGMAIQANLKLREKRVISLVSDMLVDQTESIKGIRQQ